LRTVCNSYLVNSYILAAENKEAVLIDPACCDEQQCSRMVEAVEQNQFKIVHILITHPHADHVMGTQMLKSAFPDATIMMHKEGLETYLQANDYALLMGFKKMSNIPPIDEYIVDNQEIKLSNLTLKILYTPGHAPGSVSIFCPQGNLVFTGDVLFKESIGRTDLAGGDFQTLKNMIYNKLFTLGEDTTVLPGHGNKTTIGHEKQFNPFL